MFKIDNNKNIYINRGDRMTVILVNNSDRFLANEDIIFSICNIGDYTNVVFSKTFTVTEDCVELPLDFTTDEMRFTEPIKTGEKVFWYEIQLVNRNNEEITLIGHDIKGDKLFTVWPEVVAADLGVE